MTRTTAWGLALLGLASLGLILTTSEASAAPKTVDLSEQIRRLLTMTGYKPVQVAADVPDVAMISLGTLEPGAANALSWCDAERAKGKRVLVPLQMVDGKARPYGGSGLPPYVVSLADINATALMFTGLYAEYK